jgi:hypothetical protein
MNRESALIAMALMDLLLTAAERIASQIAQARAEGLITVEEQQARLARVDAIREQVGLPKP